MDERTGLDGRPRHGVSVGYEGTAGDLRRTGAVGPLRNEVLIKLNVRTFEEGVRATTADATVPCERTP